MKLIRFGAPGKEKAGVVLNEKYYDASGIGEDYNEQFFESGGLQRLEAYVREHKEELPGLEEGVRIGSPVSRPSKIVCIGLNFADHAAETGAKHPEEPVIFMKSSSALTGPYDEVMIPEGSEKTDWEVELALVIGKKASYVSEADAMNYLAGYCLHNDVSERAFQLERGGTWDKGKGCDTFAPLGPWLVTPDEVEDVNQLRMWLKLNGETVQDGTTANLIFKVPFLISYVSRFMTLLPGDVISTGTPAGVGMGMKPARYLKPGDIMELGIDGLGESRQQAVAYAKG